MWRRRRDLLSEISEGALDQKTDLVGVLRKCLVLGGEVGSASLREWASRELKGYEGDDVPEYRRIAAPLVLDAMVGNGMVTGQSVHYSLIPDFARDHVSDVVPVTQPISTVIDLIGKAGGNAVALGVPQGHLLVDVMNQEANGHIDRIYWNVSTTSLAGIVDVVRTTLVELIAEMRAGSPSGELPSADVAEQAASVVLKGHGNRITVNTVNVGGDAGDISAPVTIGHTGGESIGRRFIWWFVAAATIAGAVFAYLAL